MKSSLYCVLSVIMFLTPVASADPAPPDWVTIESDSHTAGEDDCPLDPLHEAGGSIFCPVNWRDNDTLEPGDDDILMTAYIDEVRISIRPPLVPFSKTAEVAPKEWKINHPAYQMLNKTWIQANETSPDPMKGIVSFESRPKRWVSTGEDSEEWGVYLIAHTPEPLGESITVFRYCWDICETDDHEYLRQNETTVRPFPHGIVAREVYGYDSDDEVWVYTSNLFTIACWSHYANIAEPCDLANAQSPHHEALFVVYQNATPSIFWAAQVNQTTVAVKDSHGPPLAPQSPASSGESFRIFEGGESVASPSSPRAVFVSPPSPVTDPSDPPVDSAPGGGGEESRLVRQASAAHPDSPGALLSALAIGTLAALAIAFGAFALYHRIGRDQALEQETRGRVYEAIRKEPGVRVGTLSTQLSLSHNAVKHHVHRLVDCGFVRCDSGRQRRYFASGVQVENPKVFFGLAHPAAPALQNLLNREGPLDISSIAGELGISRNAVRRAVVTMGKAGLVTTKRQGRHVLVRLADNISRKAVEGTAAPKTCPQSIERKKRPKRPTASKPTRKPETTKSLRAFSASTP